MADSNFITLPPGAKNIQGETFGDLTALGPVKTNENGVIWVCSCACGATTHASCRALRRGSVRSCGCLARRLKVERTTTHGMSRTPEYRAWRQAIDRCLHPSHARFGDYGGRGITVCNRWMASFPDFIADMGMKPTPAHSLERRDNNQGYEPSNCYWATPREQCNNRRNTKKIDYLGESKTIAEWMRALGLPGRHSLYLYRVNAGWSAHRAFTTPSHKATPDYSNRRTNTPGSPAPADST